MSPSPQLHGLTISPGLRKPVSEKKTKLAKEIKSRLLFCHRPSSDYSFSPLPISNLGLLGVSPNSCPYPSAPSPPPSPSHLPSPCLPMEAEVQRKVSKAARATVGNRAERGRTSHQTKSAQNRPAWWAKCSHTLWESFAPPKNLAIAHIKRFVEFMLIGLISDL